MNKSKLYEFKKWPCWGLLGLISRINLFTILREALQDVDK